MPFLDLLFEQVNLGLQALELCIEGLEDAPNERRYGELLAFRSEDLGDEFRHPLDPLGCDHAKFREVGAHGVRQHCSLPDAQCAGPMHDQHRLLLLSFDRHKTHGRPRDGLADRLSVDGVVLAALDVWLNIGRRHQSNGVSHPLDLASFRDTFDEARRFLRAPRETTTESRDPDTGECDMIALARKIWAASWPIIGTKAEAYLRARKITADLSDAPLRYHPALIYRDSRNAPSRALPALVAAVTDNNGEIRGIHRTFLDPSRDAKANVASPRRALGILLGNGVRFGVIDESAIVSEGIETVLSLKSVAPHLPMVAALSAAHLAAWKIPAVLRRLIIAADNDRAGINAARKLAERAEAAGVEVATIVPQGKDFNEDLRRIAMERLRLRFAKSIPMSEFDESRHS